MKDKVNTTKRIFKKFKFCQYSLTYKHTMQAMVRSKFKMYVNNSHL